MVLGLHTVNLLQAQILITDIMKYRITTLFIIRACIAVCDMTTYSVVEIYQLLEGTLCIIFRIVDVAYREAFMLRVQVLQSVTMKTS